MRYEKVKQKYTTISISEDFMNDIKKYLSVVPGKYASVAELIRVSVTEKIARDTSWESLNNPINELKTMMVDLQKTVAELKAKERKSTNGNGHGLE